MMTVEVKVNGSVIGVAYIQNVEDLHEGKCRYLAEYYELGNGCKKTTKIIHNRSDGAAKLILKVFQWINKK